MCLREILSVTFKLSRIHFNIDEFLGRPTLQLLTILFPLEGVENHGIMVRQIPKAITAHWLSIFQLEQKV